MSDKEEEDEDDEDECFFNPDLFTSDVKVEEITLPFAGGLRLRCIHGSNQFVARFVPRVVWPAALGLSTLVEDTRGAGLGLTGSSILELGSGTGLAGLVVAKVATPRRVILTDCDAEALKLLGDNVERNRREGDNSVEIMVARLLWGVSGDVENVVKMNGGKMFEVVMATDVVYDEAAIKPLLDTACAVLVPGSGRFLLANHVSRFAGFRKAVEAHIATLPFKVNYMEPLGEDKAVTFLILERL